LPLHSHPYSGQDVRCCRSRLRQTNVVHHAQHHVKRLVLDCEAAHAHTQTSLGAESWNSRLKASEQRGTGWVVTNSGRSRLYRYEFLRRRSGTSGSVALEQSKGCWRHRPQPPTWWKQSSSVHIHHVNNVLDAVNLEIPRPHDRYRLDPSNRWGRNTHARAHTHTHTHTTHTHIQ